MGGDTLLNKSYSLALAVYYSDELSLEDRNKLVEQLNICIHNLQLEDKYKWIDRLVDEMEENNACADREDGLDHIRNKWIQIMGIVIS